MKVQTGVKAGGLTSNHNETLARGTAKKLKIQTGIKAGGWTNHNEELVRDA
jgi:hypothetical protein